MNELKLETSPYLLQHANNPVNWKAWNTQTLASAKENQKLALLMPKTYAEISIFLVPRTVPFSCSNLPDLFSEKFMVKNNIIP